MSQITTHVLDTSRGKPAEGIRIALQRPKSEDQWTEIASGITDSDGRIGNLLSHNQVLSPGNYRMFFHTKPYFEQQGTQGFYPFVGIVFEITDASHYHIPLLLNPFGYTTYRGS